MPLLGNSSLMVVEISSFIVLVGPLWCVSNPPAATCTPSKFCPNTLWLVVLGIAPVVKVEECAKAIVNGACRGERYVTVPSWFRVTYLWKVFFPEVVGWILRLFYFTGLENSPEDALSKKILDYTGLQKVVYPEIIRELKPKTK